MNLVIGEGEIGKAVFGILHYQHVDVKSYDITYSEKPTDKYIDVLHICFPYSDKFVEYVKEYINDFKPLHVIIWSTLPIGTTKQIKGAVHSPVTGKHPKLGRSIKDSVRWIGANDEVEGQFFDEFFKSLYMSTKVIDNSDYTEALKLLCTTEYGINIEFARYKKQVADGIGMDFKLTKEWNQDYNKLYHNLDMQWAQKYVLDAPEGPKGGHCVTPNARLLDKQFPSMFTKVVGEIE
jgi:hypothetical protein